MEVGGEYDSPGHYRTGQGAPSHLVHPGDQGGPAAVEGALHVKGGHWLWLCPEGQRPGIPWVAG